MFIGHYAVALALKRVEKKASLGMLFLAVQWADILYFPLVLLGIERISIVPNYTKANHFHLEYFPYSHSLAASVFWAALAYFGFKKYTRSSQVAMVMAMAVLSHWFLDLVVHLPDLPIWSYSAPLVGLGLWNHPLAAYLLEATMLIVGVWLYIGGTRPKTTGGKYGMIIYALFLSVFNAINFFSPPPPDSKVLLAVTSTIMFAVLAVMAFWLDKKRE